VTVDIYAAHACSSAACVMAAALADEFCTTDSAFGCGVTAGLISGGGVAGSTSAPAARPSVFPITIIIGMGSNTLHLR
jgi:hypothetical protein